MERMEKIQLIGSSSPYESNQASPARGWRPLPFKRDFIGFSLSFHFLLNLSFTVPLLKFLVSEHTQMFSFVCIPLWISSFHNPF
jgi:hypothetical protein